MKRITLLVLLFPTVTLGGTPIDETRPVMADARIEIENLKGQIIVTGWDRNEARITGTLGEGVEKLIVEGEGDRLRVKVDYPNRAGWFGTADTGAPSTLELQVPRGVSLNIDSVAASVTVNDIEGRRIEIDSVSGDVSVRGRPGMLEVESVSGDQAIDVASADLRLESVSGRIRAGGELTGRVHAEAVSGDIELTTASALTSFDGSTVSGDLALQIGIAPAGRLKAEAMSGSITLRLPASTSATLSASSFSGNIRSDVGEVVREKYGPGSSLNAQLGKEGSAEIEVETFSGNVRIELR